MEPRIVRCDCPDFMHAVASAAITSYQLTDHPDFHDDIYWFLNETNGRMARTPLRCCPFCGERVMEVNR